MDLLDKEYNNIILYLTFNLMLMMKANPGIVFSTWSSRCMGDAPMLSYEMAGPRESSG